MSSPSVPGELRALLDALAVAEGNPLGVSVVLHIVCHGEPQPAAAVAPAVVAAAVLPDAGGDVAMYGETELRIMLALRRAPAGWVTAQSIAEALGDKAPTREMYGVLRALCERGAIETSTGRGSRISRKGAASIDSIVNGQGHN